MTLSPIAVAGIVLEATWRRRWFILTPFLVSLPLAFLVATKLPRSYVASTLLMLQESSAGTPLTRELRYTESANEKIAAMQALLNSDRLLTEIAVEIHGPSILADKRQLGISRENLRGMLTVKAAGPEFVSLRLRGADPLGMGKTLDIIVSRLLETILSTDIDSPAAPQVVRARMMERAREADLSLRTFMSSPLVQSIAQQVRLDPERLKETLDAKAKDLAGQQHILLSTRAAEPIDITVGHTSPSPAHRSGAALQRASFPHLQVNTGATPEGEVARRETTYVRTRQEVDFLRAILVANAAQTTGAAAVESHRRRLQDLVRERGRDLENWRQRFGEAGAASLSFMRAPERILVIDPPRDPDFPVASRSRIFAMVVGAGTLLGIGMALLLELLDRRLRTARQLEALTGVPIVTYLAWSGSGAK